MRYKAVSVVICLALAISGTSCFITSIQRKPDSAHIQHTDSADTAKVIKDSVKGDTAVKLDLQIETKKAAPVAPVVQKPVFNPVTLSVEQWPGKTFIILEKVQMFRKFGHYLYTSAKFDRETAPVNAAIELPNHRLKYEPFAGRTIQILSVRHSPDGEYIITAKTDTLNLTVYGKTVSNVIEGLLDVSDLSNAVSYFSGSSVYSRRRLIDVYDSARSVFTNVKVSINEPLTVTGIRPGIIPLPPKPIWIIVERADKTRGIIPVNISWTNVPKEKVTQGNPWSAELFEQSPKEKYPQWEDYVWDAIDNHNVFIGMSREQVIMSWGEPPAVKSSALNEWVFQKSRLTFSADSLTAISQR